MSQAAQTRSWLGVGVASTGWTLFVVVTAASAQAPVDMRVNMGPGVGGTPYRVNMQIGPGDLYARPVSPLLTGNAIANGVVSNGLSLRSFSPITDPMNFHGYLGTGTLYEFRRDSVGVETPSFNAGGYARPYYDPSVTVPNVGFLRGMPVGGDEAGDIRTPTTPLNTRLQNRIQPLDTLQSQIIGLRSPGAVPDQTVGLAPAAKYGSIFGPQTIGQNLRVPEVPAPPAPQQVDNQWTAPMSLQQTPPTAGGRTPGDQRLESSRPLGKPLTDTLRADLYRTWPAPAARPPASPVIPGEQATGRQPGTGLAEQIPPNRVNVGLQTPPGALAATGTTGQPGAASGQPGALVVKSAEPAPRTSRPPAFAADTLPGFDLLTDMRLAVYLGSDPNPTWFADMQKQLQSRPDLKRQASAAAAQDAAAFLEVMRNAPLRTMASGGESELNDLLFKAESSMQIGRFQEAADRYANAALVAPQNPLPWIGQAHAFLAMGGYRSAANALLKGIALAERYPGVGEMLFPRLDLNALMGSPDTVEICRADIEKSLAQSDSWELRFLLGYVEYHSGLREKGLRDLNSAAAAPLAAGWVIRYTKMLAPEAPAVTPANPTQK